MIHRRINAQLAYFFKINPEKLTPDEWGEYHQRLKYIADSGILKLK